jgi:hypothetical protein
MGGTALRRSESLVGARVGTVPELPSSVHLRKRAVVERHRCRCGTRLPAGTLCFEFVPVPEALTGLLRAQVFCGPGCARAFLLEAMEVLEGQASPDLLSDVQSVYSYLHYMFTLAQEAALAVAPPGTPAV